MDLSRQGLLGIVPTTPAAAADHCRGARDALMRSRPAGSHARTPRARSQAIRAQLVRVTLQLEQEREAATNQRAELVAALRAHQAAAVDDMERQNARQAALLAARDEAYSETLRRSAETAAAQLRSQATAQETALAKAQAGLEREQQLRDKDAVVRPRARPPSPCSQDSQLSARQAARARVDQLRREHAKQVRYSWGGAARSGAGRGALISRSTFAQLKSELEKAAVAHRAALETARQRWEAQRAALDANDAVRRARASARTRGARQPSLCRPAFQGLIIFGSFARGPAHLVRPVHPWRTPTPPRARPPAGGPREWSAVRSRRSPPRDLGDGRPEWRARHGQRLPPSRARVRERARCLAADRRGAGSTRRPN